MYQAWTEFIRQKRRYEGNKIQPYDDLAFSVFLYWIPIEIFVPLVLESSVTSKITARRRTSFQKAWLGVQTSFPPLRFKFVKLISGISPSILNRFSRFQRRCVLLENVFPMTYNMTQYVQGIPRKNR